MVRATRRTWTLAAGAMLGLLAIGATSLTAQDGGAEGRRLAGGQDRDAMRKARQEQLAKLKQMVPTAKTSLAAAIATVEAETKGKVLRVQYEVDRDGKFTIDAGVLVNDKIGQVTVDPETGKAGAPRFEDDAGRGRREGGGEQPKKEGGGN
jgi:uncharacterized membrane protein YkoI